MNPQLQQVIRYRSRTELFIHCVDERHVGFRKIKVEDIRVGKNAVWLCRFRDDTDALLDEVAEADLRFSAYILFCQLLHNLTVQIKTSCERRIRLNSDSMRAAESDERFPVPERMAFDLVDGRNDAGEFKEGSKMRFLEVADAD